MLSYSGKGCIIMNEEILNFMIDHMRHDKPHDMKNYLNKDVPVVKNDLDEKEAMEVFHELIEVFAKHNVSYQCAVKLSLAWNEALMQGAVDLYRIDNP